jgi:hypothetical protein
LPVFKRPPPPGSERALPLGRIPSWLTHLSSVVRASVRAMASAVVTMLTTASYKISVRSSSLDQPVIWPFSRRGHADTPCSAAGSGKRHRIKNLCLILCRSRSAKKNAGFCFLCKGGGAGWRKGGHFRSHLGWVSTAASKSSACSGFQRSSA